MNKKGVQWGVLVAMIMVVVIAIALFSNTKLLGNILEKEGNKDICIASVLGAALNKKLRLNTETNLRQVLQCKTEEVFVDTSEKKEIMSIFAENMFDCWKKFGEGKIDFLGDFDFGFSDIRCFRCAEINFGEKSLGVTISFGEFEKYLKETESPIDGKTYAEYFLDGENREIYRQSDNKFSLSKDVPVDVLYIGAKKSISGGASLRNIGEMVYAPFGLSKDFSFWSYVVPRDLAVERCDTLQ